MLPIVTFGNWLTFLVIALAIGAALFAIYGHGRRS
jgi:hypothetical protein